MINLRLESISKLSDIRDLTFAKDQSPQNFRSHVFCEDKMRRYLTQEAFSQIQKAAVKGTRLTDNIADQMASALKAWAISMQATHFTHWFQPLTGVTAEKHDTFHELSSSGQILEVFDGKKLVQNLPDELPPAKAGERNTFEARGYASWDLTSPPFIYGTTLCIPAVFVSYTGSALDYKTPLLKSLHALDQAATHICRYFDKNVSHVQATLGWEQEYFIVDRQLALTRPDILLTGRTLMGHDPARGEHIDGHYFGGIPNRVLRFMHDLENECHQLGIPIKTHHNELAPHQFELTPIFEEANLAVDHNILVMDLMNRLAEKHQLQILLHEKPFKGINGSGKHCNWSLTNSDGINLLSPGKNPMQNLQFLSFFINTLVAVSKHSGLLRAVTSSGSNDLRLGRDEAPPKVLSVFIGDQLTHVLEELEHVSKGKLSPEEKTELKLNLIGRIPEKLLDNTDLNRTAPLAFTGNKFELRTVGSQANCAQSITALNSMVCQQLNAFKAAVDLLVDQEGMKKDDAIFNVLRDQIKDFRDLLFEEEIYSDTWEKQLKKKKWFHADNVPEALKILTQPKVVELFDSLEVLNPKELEVRYEIRLQAYLNRIRVESRTLGDLARNHIIPTALKYQSVVISNVEGFKTIYGADFQNHAQEQMEIIERLSKHISALHSGIGQMIETRKEADTIIDLSKKAFAYAERVLPFLEEIRYHCDKLELLVDDHLWPLAKYRELLFLL